MKQILIQNIPSDLKADFKAACAKRRKAMRTVLLNFMKSYSRLAVSKERKDNSSG